jgi:7-cyano-7-deazaguanine synthase in queuosine biosynthesis
MIDENKKLALVAVVGESDKGIDLSSHHYLKSAILGFFHYRNKEDVSMHIFLDELKHLGLKPSETAMDLLVIACTMYAADTRIKRTKYGEDSWTRIIDLYIPVSDVNLWNAQRKNLEQIFKFLTGDIWTIVFRERHDKTLKLSPEVKLKKYKMPYQTDTVCLFSGGLDSFVGAIDLLSEGVRPLLVSHSKAADVSPSQKNCAKALEDYFISAIPKKIHAFIRIPKDKLFDGKDGIENSERGRSFLFLALGGITASTLGDKTKLYMPENGLISLNIPLNSLRIGSHSTRTTHPHYLAQMDSLFESLKLGAKIINPFQFKTKGQMLMECKVSQLIIDTQTMSCSHSLAGRWSRQGNTHCGYCVPCIIRQASYKSAKLKDKSIYRVSLYTQPLNSANAEGTDVFAFKYMIEKCHRNPNYITTLIRNTGTLGIDVAKYIDVYKKGIEEVSQLLKNVRLQ